MGLQKTYPWLVLVKQSPTGKERIASRWETREKAEARAKVTKGYRVVVVHERYQG